MDVHSLTTAVYLRQDAERAECRANARVVELKSAMDQMSEKLDRYAGALREIARETGTPYARIANDALGELAEVPDSFGNGSEAEEDLNLRCPIAVNNEIHPPHYWGVRQKGEENELLYCIGYSGVLFKEL